MPRQQPRDKDAARSRPPGRPPTEAPPLVRLEQDPKLSIEKQVYKSLRYALMTGAIAPGSALTTRSLSTALGVSPTPVREALKRLDADGALVSRSKSGFFVNNPTQVDFLEILEIRLNLEGLAIRLAAGRATKENLKPIIALAEEYKVHSRRKKPSMTDTLRANFNFHFKMYELSNSRQLVNIIETLWLRIGPVLHHSFVPNQDVSWGYKIHEQMIRALENHDGPAAEAAVRLDLTTASKFIIPTLKSATSG